MHYNATLVHASAVTLAAHVTLPCNNNNNNNNNTLYYNNTITVDRTLERASAM